MSGIMIFTRNMSSYFFKFPFKFKNSTISIQNISEDKNPKLHNIELNNKLKSENIFKSRNIDNIIDYHNEITERGTFQLYYKLENFKKKD